MTPRSKRSRSVTLSALGAASMLSGCEAPVDEAKLSAERFGAPTQVAAFQSVADCVAAGTFTQSQCSTAQSQAAAEDRKTAPQYMSREECEQNFGAAQCVQRSSGGGSFFTPLLTGFMIGQLMNGGNRYAPLYRDSRDNRYYTGSGAWLTPGGGRGGYSVGQRALTAPAATTTQRIQTRSSVVSRGGFGGRASSSSRGGWGGS
jgi:uncharacterized protein YgiB involved in biofilm formation